MDVKLDNVPWTDVAKLTLIVHVMNTGWVHVVIINQYLVVKKSVQRPCLIESQFGDQSEFAMWTRCTAKEATIE